MNILVNYFENFEIMDEDVGRWLGHDTFSALIRCTKYRHLPHGEAVYSAGDEAEGFYFVLQGAVRLSASAEEQAERLGQNYVFGQTDIFHSGSRKKDCTVSSQQGVHLAF